MQTKLKGSAHALRAALRTVAATGCLVAVAAGCVEEVEETREGVFEGDAPALPLADAAMPVAAPDAGHGGATLDGGLGDAGYTDAATPSGPFAKRPSRGSAIASDESGTSLVVANRATDDVTFFDLGGPGEPARLQVGDEPTRRSPRVPLGPPTTGRPPQPPRVVPWG